MIIHKDIIQGSDEWKRLRAGKFTATSIGTLLSKSTTKGYQDLIKRIARERKTGNPVEEDFKGKWMQRGNDLEAEALKQYALDNMVHVERIGFIERNEWIGCSPDGMVGVSGLVQVKCLKWNTFFDIDNISDADSDYYEQCQFEMMIAEREWNDLYFYDPELKAKIFRIYPDYELWENAIKSIEKAIPLVEEAMAKIHLR